MTDWKDELPLSDDLQLDLLVDNELTEAQRQRLLAHLEGEPERWRMLALRFVEGQMTGRGVQRWMAETRNAGTQTLPGRKRANARRLKARERWFMVLAMCVAFGCGVATDGWLSGSGENSPAPIAQSTTPASPSETDPADSTKSDNQTGPASLVQQTEPGSPANQTERPPITRALQPEPRYTVARSQPDITGRRVKVPLRRVRRADGRQAWSPRVRLAASKELALQQSGLDVQRRLGIVRVPLGGERHVMMPAQHMQVVRRVRHRI